MPAARACARAHARARRPTPARLPACLEVRGRQTDFRASRRAWRAAAGRLSLEARGSWPRKSTRTATRAARADRLCAVSRRGTLSASARRRAARVRRCLCLCACAAPDCARFCAPLVRRARWPRAARRARARWRRVSVRELLISAAQPVRAASAQRQASGRVPHGEQWCASSDAVSQGSHANGSSVSDLVRRQRCAHRWRWPAARVRAFFNACTASLAAAARAHGRRRAMAARRLSRQRLSH